MNRGEYEGQVGVAVYYFDDNKNAVQEKDIYSEYKVHLQLAEDELGKMVYFNEGQQMLYVLAGGTSLSSVNGKIMSRPNWQKIWTKDSMWYPRTDI